MHLKVQTLPKEAFKLQNSQLVMNKIVNQHCDSLAQNCTKIIAQKFVPFLKERDSMNRLVQKLDTISPERTDRKNSGGAVNYSKEKWRQNSQGRVKSPLKKSVILNELSLSNSIRQLDKQRSFSHADYKIKLIQAYTERGPLNGHQDESIQQINMYQEELCQPPQELSKAITQRSPLKTRVIRQESMHSDINKLQHQNSERLKLYNQISSKHQYKSNGEIRKSDIKLPALLLKQYMKEMLDGNQKIKDVINEKDETKYEFPPEFEQRIISMKKDLRKMKIKLKNWEQDRRTDDDLKHLKEVANSIISRQDQLN